MDIQREAPSFPSRPYLARRLSGRRTVELYSSRRIARETGGEEGRTNCNDIPRRGRAINRNIFHLCGMALDSVCFIPPSPSFSVYFSRGARLSSVLFPFNRAPLGSLVISITTLYATLIIVGVMSSRKSSKMQPRRISPSRFFPATIPPSLSFSFPLVSGAGMSKGCSLSLSLSRHSRDGYFANLRITAHFHGADLVKGLIRSRLARFAPC